MQYMVMPSDSEQVFTIVANVSGDATFREGAKCWLISGTGGEGWYKFQWYGLNRFGRMVQKWSPTKRFTNFRAKFIPPNLKAIPVWFVGTREEMEAQAEKLNEFRETLEA